MLVNIAGLIAELPLPSVCNDCYLVLHLELELYRTCIDLTKVICIRFNACVINGLTWFYEIFHFIAKLFVIWKMNDIFFCSNHLQEKEMCFFLQLILWRNFYEEILLF